MRPIPQIVAYCASKAALNHLTRVMTLELGPHSIRVNCVCPNVVKTDMTKPFYEVKSKYEVYLQKVPLRRPTELEDVVNAVVFLLSEGASLISGVPLPVDGGLTAVLGPVFVL